MNYHPELTGIGKYTGEMADWLASRGHEVRVVTALPYYPAWRISDAYRGRGYVVEDGGPGRPLVTRCPLYVPAKATGLRRILHLLSFALSSLPAVLREVAARPPDVIWTVEPTLFCAPVALAAGRLAGAPVWLHVQDLEVHAAFELGLLPSGGAIQSFALGVERVLTRSFQRVSSISRNMMERALSHVVPRDRLLFFPNWVDIHLIRRMPPEAPNRFRQELGLEGKTVFLYSGNMGNKQGLEVLPPLIRALQHRQDIHFVFCGDGTYRQELEEAIGGVSNVTRLPLQPLSQLNDLLNLADVHLLPQRADAADLVMPSKLTGMFASGRPVLATAAHGTQVQWMVRGGKTETPCGMVVPPDDADALLRAVEALAADTALRQAMGSCAREFALQYFSSDVILQRLENDLVKMQREFRRPVPL